MKVTYQGFDPEIEKEYANSPGFVILRGKPSQQASQPEEEMPYGLDAQEQQDWINSQWRKRREQSAEASETEESGETEELAGKKRAMGRMIQGFQFAARSKGVDLGPLSARKILELADKGELKGLESAVEQVRKAVKTLV